MRMRPRALFLHCMPTLACQHEGCAAGTAGRGGGGRGAAEGRGTAGGQMCKKPHRRSARPTQMGNPHNQGPAAARNVRKPHRSWAAQTQVMNPHNRKWNYAADVQKSHQSSARPTQVMNLHNHGPTAAADVRKPHARYARQTQMVNLHEQAAGRRYGRAKTSPEICQADSDEKSAQLETVGLNKSNQSSQRRWPTTRAIRDGGKPTVGGRPKNGS